MIRQGKIFEIPEILAITAACSKHMIEKDIFQWNQHYPSKQIFEKDVDRSELYVLEMAGQIIGTIVVSIHRDDEYAQVDWLTPNKDNIYVHRLAVHPDFQGKGFARKLMDFAEKHAREKGCLSVRLDTFSKNQRNQRFYEARGYQKLGDIIFPKQSEHPFHCYELVLQ
ncbi:Acetyltransferase (GNAT) family protein [Pricia antarctica]|uniref:Acetyltransferase (GNAT) family protein n=1 Tax=Pricia antarctica TaxID=641691 RepID=A0A1G7H952_9FLAO|nr:GNAT family N-acetyltransferase [Pricia antarctica]SDE96915.1 Acetyltransferase (GNAT) family protein [Pricia antarctica]